MAKRNIALKQQLYYGKKQGKSIAQLADEYNISERMVYRHIDEYELHELRTWKARFDNALTKVGKDEPVSKLIFVIKNSK